MAKCAMMVNKAGNLKDSLPVRPAYLLVNWPRSLGVGWEELRSPASVPVHTHTHTHTHTLARALSVLM